MSVDGIIDYQPPPSWLACGGAEFLVGPLGVARLHDWRGVTDGLGGQVPFTRTAARAALRDPVFTAWLIAESQRPSNFLDCAP